MTKKIKVYEPIQMERILGSPRFVRLLRDFRFYSEVLNRDCIIPKGFVYDEESIPFFKGNNPEAGAIHDYLCRIDSDPVISQKTSAKVYKEFQKYFDEMESGNFFNRTLDNFWIWIKTFIVTLGFGCYHKHYVNETYEQFLKGKWTIWRLWQK